MQKAGRLRQAASAKSEVIGADLSAERAERKQSTITTTRIMTTRHNGAVLKNDVSHHNRLWFFPCVFRGAEYNHARNQVKTQLKHWRFGTYVSHSVVNTIPIVHH